MANRVDRITMYLSKCKILEYVQEGRKMEIMETDIENLENDISEIEKKISHSLVHENECTSNAAGFKRV